MKSDFHKTYVQPFPQRAAEACSELGFAAAEQRKRALWVSRLLEVTRRWFAGNRNS